MSATQDLLFELGSEELPPKSLLTLSLALLNHIEKGLQAADLNFVSSQAYATPRRLAVHITGLNTVQTDKTVEKRGPALQAAFNADGSPTKAAQGFASSCGVTVDQLERLQTDKGEWLVFRQSVQGQSTENLIPDIIRKSIQQLPIAKRMRWGDYPTEFVRPVHWCVLLFGNQVIDSEILGLKTGNQSRGHRFHAPEPILIDHPQNYARLLNEKGRVIADFEARKTLIRSQAEQIAQTVQGIAHIEDDLLEEIAALNEWPVAVLGHYPERFLALPNEVLITSMQTNQKYFPVKSATGNLLPHFITFSNIASTNPESIQKGNERVILPRLADAEFFWNQDRKLTLEQRVEQLKHIVFQKDLGTLFDKTERVVALSKQIAETLNLDPTHAMRAARLAKTDLVTQMVGEFANLQGLMGRYYALADNEAEEVAIALEEHYFPKQSGGATPSGSTGQIVAIAEKLDTLTGIFSASLIPSGDKDPYALRRATLGLLRTMIENQVDLDLISLIDSALAQFNHPFDQAQTRDKVIDFIYDRLKGYALEQGFHSDEFEAVMAVKPSRPLDFMQRLSAVQNFRQRPEAESLSAANKRIINLLKKSDTVPAEQITALQEPQELTLHQKAQDARDTLTPLLAQRDYQAALTHLAELKEPVDAFFDHVMVNTDDLVLRANRLALLQLLSEQFLHIADISKLQS